MQKMRLNTLLDNGVVPIINENDVTAVDELVFGDNDQLVAYVANYFDAKLLTILTDIDGFYDLNPHVNKDAKLLKEVNYIDPKDLEATHSANSEFATGGIVTKLKAADFLMKNGKKLFLTSGFNLEYAKDYLLNGNHTKGTIFKA